MARPMPRLPPLTTATMPARAPAAGATTSSPGGASATATEALLQPGEGPLRLGLLGLDLGQYLRPRGVDDVLGRVEQLGDALGLGLGRGRRGDQAAVLPVDVGEAALVLRAVIGAAP